MSNTGNKLLAPEIWESIAHGLNDTYNKERKERMARAASRRKEVIKESKRKLGYISENALENDTELRNTYREGRESMAENYQTLLNLRVANRRFAKHLDEDMDVESVKSLETSYFPYDGTVIPDDIPEHHVANTINRHIVPRISQRLGPAVLTHRVVRISGNNIPLYFRQRFPTDKPEITDERSFNSQSEFEALEERRSKRRRTILPMESLSDK